MTTVRPAERVRRVLVLAHFEKPSVRELCRDLEPWLAARAENVALRTDVRAFTLERARNGAAADEEALPDLLVVVGGDGALLGAVRAFADTPVPTVGINLGRVGFLASTPASRWEETLTAVFEGRGILEPRMRVEAEWTGPGGTNRAIALNEVVLARGSHQGMLTATLHVGEDWVTDYRADGLILATPSGSTAYSLSSGGPILDPNVSGIVVTPICSQGLSNRPIVLASDRELAVTVRQSSGITTLAVDGQRYFPLHQGQVVQVRRHPNPYPLFAMPGLDPFRRLRDRLGWGTPFELGSDEDPGDDPLSPSGSDGGVL